MPSQIVSTAPDAAIDGYAVEIAALGPQNPKHGLTVNALARVFKLALMLEQWRRNSGDLERTVKTLICGRRDRRDAA
jgi:hypothetical protein